MSDTERIGEFLSVRRFPADPNRRTSRWAVLSNHNDTLGWVSWFGRWRQYTFDPAPQTTFNAGCLKDITAFLGRVNQEHRAKRAQSTEPRKHIHDDNRHGGADVCPDCVSGIEGGE